MQGPCKGGVFVALFSYENMYVRNGSVCCRDTGLCPPAGSDLRASKLCIIQPSCVMGGSFPYKQMSWGKEDPCAGRGQRGQRWCDFGAEPHTLCPQVPLKLCSHSVGAVAALWHPVFLFPPQRILIGKSSGTKQGPGLSIQDVGVLSPVSHYSSIFGLHLSWLGGDILGRYELVCPQCRQYSTPWRASRVMAGKV